MKYADSEWEKSSQKIVKTYIGYLRHNGATEKSILPNRLHVCRELSGHSAAQTYLQWENQMIIQP